jgi:hypothetical protein
MGVAGKAVALDQFGFGYRFLTVPFFLLTAMDTIFMIALIRNSQARCISRRPMDIASTENSGRNAPGIFC